MFLCRQSRAKNIAKKLASLFPKASIALYFSTPWELVVAVMLSAQTTDKKVNEVTPVLFKKYKTIKDYALADKKELERVIKSIGLYKTKAKNIIHCADILLKKYNGALPHTMEELTALPGIGRKTANIILGNAFGIVEGIAVDTHVRRLAIKFDLTSSTNPDRIEKDLMELFSKKEWLVLTYRFIEYGRTICPARKHDCSKHPLTKLYPPAANIWFSPSKNKK